MKCENCFAPLAAQAGIIVCEKCGTPHLLGSNPTPFEIFQVPVSYTVDLKSLEDKYYALSRRLHPDRFAAAGKGPQLIKIQSLSAALNGAYAILREPEPRIEALLRLSGALSEKADSKTSSQIPADLAEEYFELQEAQMENPERAASLCESLMKRLSEKHSKLTTSLVSEAGSVDWSNPKDPKIDKILEFRRERSYIRSMLSNLEKSTRGNHVGDL